LLSATEGSCMARMLPTNPRVRRALLGLPMAIALFVPANTEAVVLCADARADGSFSTTVKIRERCRPREAQLTPSLLGLQPPAALLKDAVGTVVGVPFDRTDRGFRVFGTAAGTPVTLAVAEAGFLLGDGPTVTFESGDCSGTPLMTVD